MALSYSNISVELREISLRDRPAELYAASSKGTVPVLITSDENVIDESLEIMFWALNNNDTQTWLNKNSHEEINLINNNDTTFKKWLDKYKYHEYSKIPSELMGKKEVISQNKANEELSKIFYFGSKKIGKY